MDMLDFGRLFAERRVAAGYSSQEALAMDLGVTQQSVNSYENGDSLPGKDKWGAIKTLINLDMSEIAPNIIRPPRKRRITQISIGNERVFQAGHNQTFNGQSGEIAVVEQPITPGKKYLIQLILAYAPDKLVEQWTRQLESIRDIIR